LRQDRILNRADALLRTVKAGLARAAPGRAGRKANQRAARASGESPAAMQAEPSLAGSSGANAGRRRSAAVR